MAALLLALVASLVEQPGLFALAAVSLVYPALLHWCLARFCNSSHGARLSMHVDAMLVSVMGAGVGVDSPTFLVFVAMLLISTLIVGSWQLLVSVLAALSFSGFLMASIAVGYSNRPALSDASAHLVDVVSLSCLLGYTLIVACLVYHETRLLAANRRQAVMARQHHERLSSRISRFLAPQLVRQLSDDVVRRRKRLTVFFSDIQGFTHLMDTADETMIAELLGNYFESMNQIAVGHGGTVDKFIGDGMMVFFGDPESGGAAEDAAACLAMAVKMREQLKLLNVQWRSRLPELNLQIRVGIHTGYCLVGAFGGAERLEYTALGGAVNLASRIEQLAHPGGILISAATHHLLSDRVVAEDLGFKAVKGMEKPVQVFSVNEPCRVQTPSAGPPRLTLLGSGGPV